MKDYSTVLHYAAKYGNEDLARAARETKSDIDINQRSQQENFKALHQAIMFRQEGVMAILLEHGAHREKQT